MLKRKNLPNLIEKIEPEKVEQKTSTEKPLETAAKDTLTVLMDRAPESILKQSTIPEYLEWNKNAGFTGKRYAVQVGAFVKPVPVSYFKDLKNIKSYIGKDKITRYVIGQLFNDRTLAAFLKNETQENTAYKDAFIVELDKEQLSAEHDIDSDREIPAIKGKIIYKVQIGAYKEKVPLNLSLIYMNIEGIKVETTSEGMLVLAAGSFATYKEALKSRNQVISKGIVDAYIVAYKEGQKISIERAKEYTNE